MYYWQYKLHMKGGKNNAKLDLNPSLSARNQDQRKLLLILFYVDTGSLLTSRQKQNQHKHRQVVADFLQRITKQGWASEAKPIPTPYFKKPRTRRRGITTFTIHKNYLHYAATEIFGGCFLERRNNYYLKISWALSMP